MFLIGSQYLFTNILRKQIWDVVQYQILLKQRCSWGFNFRDDSSSVVFLLISFFWRKMVPYKSIKSINNFVRLGNVLLCTLFKLCGSCHYAVFLVEGQVMIDRTFRKEEGKIPVNPFCLIHIRSTSTVACLGSASEYFGRKLCRPE